MSNLRQIKRGNIMRHHGLKIQLVIESSDGNLWGRVSYDDNLIIDTAKNIEGIERKMKKLLHSYHNLDSNAVTFDIRFDLTAVFEKYNYLKISTIAEKAKINPGLLRQYASGVKSPSSQQAKKVEDAIHEIGRELSTISIYAGE